MKSTPPAPETAVHRANAKKDRTIKKDILGTAHSAALAFPPGFRDAAKLEIQSIIDSFHTPKKFETRISEHEGELFLENGSFDNLVEIVLRSRILWDVKLRILKKRCHSFPALMDSLKKISWDNILFPETSVLIKAVASGSEVENARRVKETCADILSSLKHTCHFEAPKNATDFPLPISINLERNVLTVEISITGSPLYMRGYRVQTSSLAPLREDIAAACIQQTLSWSNSPELNSEKLNSAELKPAELNSVELKPSEHNSPKPNIGLQQTHCTIYAPFAGSGTLGFEALLEIASIPTHTFGRHYGFEKLTGFRPASLAWIQRKVSAQKPKEHQLPHIIFVERDQEQNNELVGNANRFFDLIAPQNSIDPNPSTNANTNTKTPQADPAYTASCSDIFTFQTKDIVHAKGNIFIAMNPPFGLRMGKGISSIPAFYTRIGKHIKELIETATLKKCFVSGFVLCPSEESWRAFLAATHAMEHKTTHFMLGGKDIRLCMFKSGDKKNHVNNKIVRKS